MSSVWEWQVAAGKWVSDILGILVSKEKVKIVGLQAPALLDAH